MFSAMVRPDVFVSCAKLIEPGRRGKEISQMMLANSLDDSRIAASALLKRAEIKCAQRGSRQALKNLLLGGSKALLPIAFPFVPAIWHRLSAQEESKCRESAELHRRRSIDMAKEHQPKPRLDWIQSGGLLQHWQIARVSQELELNKASFSSLHVLLSG